MFPNFIEKRFSSLPYQRNQGVQCGIAKLKTALLEAAIADRRRRRRQCILTIVHTKLLLQSQLDPTAWRNMSSHNQIICKRLRYQEKCRLEKKLKKLRERSQPQGRPTFMRMNAIPPKRHTVIGTNEIDNDMAAVLNLGPSFAISRKVTNATIDEALCGIHHFAHRLRSRIQRGPTVLDRESTLLCSMPFPSRAIRLPDSIPSVDSKIATLELAVQRIYQNEAAQKYRSNLTLSERRGFKKLISMKDKLRLSALKSPDFVYECMTNSFPLWQEEELEAVVSFFGEQYVAVDRSGDLLRGRISIELEESSTAILLYVTNGEERKSFNTKQLPPVQLIFQLPKEYPDAQPELRVDCVWISKDWTEKIQKELSRVVTENSGFPVLFIASQEVKDFVQNHQQEAGEICLDDNPYSCAHDIRGSALLDLSLRTCREYDEKVFAERCHDCE
ncbi:hypothetical protein Y032_0308g2060 [Ancylostoma ceylanicum]|nr:hypothetical protein Y032_0308g2060 [Ancylostoma ceylanicum]